MDEADDSAVIEELIHQIGLGNQVAYGEFYDRFHGLIYATALRVLSDPTEAEDVGQDVMFLLWEKAPLYDPAKGKPLTWAITMTRNRAIDRVRFLQRRQRLLDHAEEEGGHHREERVSRIEVEEADRARILRMAVSKLVDEQREAVELAYFKGMTQQQIAERLKIPLGTVKARIRRGMLRLKKLVGSSI